jgi:hypothetical protein
MDSQKQKDIISSWTSHGQGHIFRFLDQLNENEKNTFFAQLEVFFFLQSIAFANLLEI